MEVSSDEAVSGLRNIEQWRKDIKDWAELILNNINMKSFFTDKKLQGYNLSANSSIDMGYSGLTNMGSWAFNLYCNQKKECELSIGYFNGLHNAKISLKEINVPAELVQVMREKLEDLIILSEEAFPELKEKLKPFLKAGKMKK